MPIQTTEGLFKDPITGLPLYLDVIDGIETQLVRDNALGLLYIEVERLDKVEINYGSKVYEEIVRNVAETMTDMKGSTIRNEDLITACEPESSQFIIFLSEKRRDRGKARLTKIDVETVSDRVQAHLFSKLFFTMYTYTKERPRISVGYSFIVNNPLIKPRRMIYKLIEEAKQIARLQKSRTDMKSKEKLQRLILEEKIVTLFQPIVDLKTYKIMGYEALTRGPAKSEFETPLMLFALAEETGLVFELDRLCRKKAIQNAKHINNKMKLFINTFPTSIHDPEFKGKYLNSWLDNINIKPENLVFEITERSAIDNLPLFREAINYYTNIGVAIAIDDLGAGYSSLESIIEIKPTYLKFDINMVKNIDKSFLKKEMLRTLQLMGANINAHVIAEGIETQEEQDTLVALGIQFGQGFLIARPGLPFPKVEEK